MPELWERSDMNGSEGTETLERTRRAPRTPPCRTRIVAPGLDRLIKLELVPRVALARALTSRRGTKAAITGAFTSKEIAKFARLVVAADDRQALAFIERTLALGCSLEVLYLELFQPVARHLGEQWETDACDFATVTLGLCQLHRLLRKFSADFREIGRTESGLHALLTPSASEQHSLGLAMVAEFLRRAGWAVKTGPFSHRSEFADTVRSEWFTVIGFSLSCDSGLDRLASQIQAARRASLNRAVWVMVGGRVFAERPELVARIGADFTARDAKQAAMIAQNLALTTAECRT